MRDRFSKFFPQINPTVKRQLAAVSPYLCALAIFLGSRFVVFTAIFFAAKFVPQNPAETFWNANSSWYHYLLRYDAGWYLRIVLKGYSFTGDNLIEQPVVFYPLYPLLSKLLWVTLGIPPEAGVLVISNIAIVLAMLLFCKLVADDYGKDVSFIAVAFVSFFPTSLFFSAGYTESLAFLLIVSFFLFLNHQGFLSAACAAGLASATRSAGIVLLLPLFWELWRKWSKQPARLIQWATICTVVATSGLWLYMLFLWKAFGHPLAFITGVRAWLRGGDVGSNFVQMITLQPFAHLSAVWVHGCNPNSLDPWFFLLFLAVILLGRKRLPASYFLFGLGILLLPYASISTTLGFRSFTRYVLLAFPVFVVMADLFKARLWAVICTLGIFAALLFAYSAMFAQWYWVG